MHEFIIPIIILVLTTYVMLPVEKVLPVIRKDNIKLIILTPLAALSFFELKGQGILNTIYLLIVYLLSIRLLSNPKELYIALSILSVLIIVANRIQLIPLSNSFGVVFYAIILVLVSKGVLQNE